MLIQNIYSSLENLVRALMLLPLGTVNEPPKCPSTMISSHLLQDSGSHGKTVN